MTNCKCDFKDECFPGGSFVSGGVECKFSGQFKGPLPCLPCQTPLAPEVVGTCCPTTLNKMLFDGNTTWTELIVPEVLCIPKQKPNIEQLISVSAKLDILSQRVVATPIGLADVHYANNEGTRLTGRKLIIEGLLRQKVMYVADVPEQTVHTAHFDIPFSAFIILTGNEPLSAKYWLDTCIEDIYITDLNKRQIFKNVTVFIKAKQITC